MAAVCWEVNRMAAKKQTRRAPSRRKKQRSWRIPKILLFLSYSAVLVALGAIFFMKAEVQRFKGSGRERVIEDSASEKNTSSTADKQKTETKTASASNAGEITSEEKKQLENILRSRSSQ